MAIFILMKSIHEREDQGVVCQEVVGTYAGAVKVDSTVPEAVQEAVEDWIINYLKHLDPKCDFAFKQAKCKDENVFMSFDLLEPVEDEEHEVFESLYVYPLRAALYKESQNA